MTTIEFAETPVLPVAVTRPRSRPVRLVDLADLPEPPVPTLPAVGWQPGPLEAELGFAPLRTCVAHALHLRGARRTAG